MCWQVGRGALFRGREMSGLFFKWRMREVDGWMDLSNYMYKKGRVVAINEN